jgi:hypothetical protein
VDRNFIAERLIELENKKNILLENRDTTADVEMVNLKRVERVQDPEDDLDRFYAKRRQKN